MKRSAQPNVKTVQIFLGTEFMYTGTTLLAMIKFIGTSLVISKTEFVTLMVVIHASLTSSVMNIT